MSRLSWNFSAVIPDDGQAVMSVATSGLVETSLASERLPGWVEVAAVCGQSLQMAAIGVHDVDVADRSSLRTA
jgi:hypothetical protein